jgi:PAS domain S-box-containing protein
MPFSEHGLKVISSRHQWHFLHPKASVMILVTFAAFASVVLTIDISRPQSAPVLIPVLVSALIFALALFVFSLWTVRREQRGTDQAFRNTDCEFSSIFQNVLDGILILDSESRCLDVNPAGASILRIPRTGLIGKNVSTFFTDSEAFCRKWQVFLQSKNQRGRAQLIAGDGASVVVDFSAAADYLPGRHIFILCDVTERTHAEKALQKSEERFRCVADTIHEIIWRMNAATQEITYVNPAYAAITGHSVESLRTNPSSYRELIHPEDRIRVLSRLQETVSSGTFDEEFRFTRADGTIRWIWAKGFPVPSDGETQWLVGTALDISSRKQAETKISEQLDAVEAARAEAEALRKSTLALSQNLAMDSVLDTLLNCISELVPFDRATILLVESGHELMVAREAPRSEPKRIGLTLSASENTFLQRVLFEKKALLLTNVTKESEWLSVPPLDDVQSWLGIPLLAAGRVLGILSIGSNTPGIFTAEHLRLAKSLAVPAVVAIQNARVHERAEIYASELEARLQELSETKTALEHMRRIGFRPQGNNHALR